MKARYIGGGGLLIPSMPKGQVLQKGRGSVLVELCGGEFPRKKWSPEMALKGGSDIIIMPLRKIKSENIA